MMLLLLLDDDDDDDDDDGGDDDGHGDGDGDGDDDDDDDDDGWWCRWRCYCRCCCDSMSFHVITPQLIRILAGLITVQALKPLRVVGFVQGWNHGKSLCFSLGSLPLSATCIEWHGWM